MAIVDFPPTLWPWIPRTAGNTPAYTSITLNAVNDRAAFIVQVPKAGTLDKFEWLTGAVANNPDNGVRCSFQTVDFTTGFPDGTQDQYRDITGTLSASTWQEPGLMTSDGTDVGSKRTVTKGEWIACVIEFVNFVTSDSFAVSVLREDLHFYNRYVADGSAGTYAKSISSMPVMALKYDDGTYATFEYPCWPISAINSYSFTNASTPDERAAKFSFDAPVRVAGAWGTIDLDNDCDLVLYNSGGTALATVTLDASQRTGSVALPVIGRFDTSVTLTAGQTYYLAVKPGGSAVSMITFSAAGASQMQGYPNGGDWYLSTRTDEGSWTDTTTEWPVLGLIIDGVDDGGGGGGGGGGSFTFVG